MLGLINKLHVITFNVFHPGNLIITINVQVYGGFMHNVAIGGCGNGVILLPVYWFGLFHSQSRGEEGAGGVGKGSQNNNGALLE